jgi:homoserine O-succinyltransferase
VLHLDNIERRRLPRKLSGVFVSVKAQRDEIVADAPFQWSLPHSRYNGLIEQDLVSRGYRILYQSPATGADVFVKNGASLNIFIQGHPEYEADTLLREHRRDVGRFLAGGISEYPEVPSGYFSDDAIAALSAFRQRTLRHRDISLLRAFPTAVLERKLSSPWRLPAVRLYENWMSYLVDHKTSARERLDRSSQ